MSNTRRIKKPRKVQRVALPPGVHHLVIKHDDWCDLLNQQGPCTCEPDIEVVAGRMKATAQEVEWCDDQAG